jgi:hypothetical protein
MIIQEYLSIIWAGITAVCAQGREYQEKDGEEGLHCREDQYRMCDTEFPPPYQSIEAAKKKRKKCRTSWGRAVPSSGQTGAS